MKRRRTASLALVIGCLIAPAPRASAQAKEAPAPEDVRVHNLTVSPKAAPLPRLRYQLLPNYAQKVPGNAALAYHRAMLLMQERNTAINGVFKTQEERVQFHVTDENRFGEWQAKPRTEVPLDEFRRFVAARAAPEALKAVRIGTNSSRCDWDTNRLTDATTHILPEMQGTRALTRQLKLATRLAVLEAKPDEALALIRDGIALAKGTGEGGTLINMLVGNALFAIQFGEVEYLIQQPEAPNLYWALADLPTPLLDTREMIEGEMRYYAALLAGMRDADRGPMTEAKAWDLLVQLAAKLHAMGGEGLEKASALEEFGMRAGLELVVGTQQESARRTLKAVGKSEKEIDAMAPTQRYIVAEWFVCQDMFDAILTGYRRPLAQAARESDRLEAELKKAAAGDSTNPLRQLLRMLVPAVNKSHTGTERIERQRAALCTVEALRLYAAKAGKLPAQLADITAVTLPNDPLTDRPFEYRLEGETAVLLVPSRAGVKPGPQNNERYEITLTK